MRKALSDHLRSMHDDEKSTLADYGVARLARALGVSRTAIYGKKRKSADGSEKESLFSLIAQWKEKKAESIKAGDGRSDPKKALRKRSSGVVMLAP